MQIVVRPAVIDDAVALGRVHVQSWQAAYRGLMPADYLEGLDVEVRGQQWTRRLGAPSQFPTVVAAVDGEVVGFATFGPAEEHARPGDGELYAINVRPDLWRHGVGRALLAAVLAGLVEREYDRALLWVLPGNQRARAVYEHYGWQLEGAQRTAEILGVTVDEIRYHRPLP